MTANDAERKAETHYFRCISCGSEIFERSVDSFADGEEEACSECGARHMITAEEHGADVKLIEVSQ